MSRSTRVEMLRALGEYPSWEWSEDAQELIEGALESEDVTERQVAAELVSEIMTPDLAETVIEMLRSDPDPDVRVLAAVALGPALEEFEEQSGYLDDDLPLRRGQYEQAVELLHEVFEDTRAPDALRRMALEAAVHAPRPWQNAAVREAYVSPDPGWRRTAVLCMGFVSGFDAEIVEAIRSEDESIRFIGVLAAGEACCGEAAPELCRIAVDDEVDRNLRLAAIFAMPNMELEAVDDTLYELSSSSDAEIAESAEEALTELGLMAELDRLPDEYGGYDVDYDDEDGEYEDEPDLI